MAKAGPHGGHDGRWRDPSSDVEARVAGADGACPTTSGRRLRSGVRE